MRLVERELIERDAQLRVFDGLYAQAALGQGAAVAVAGSVASGKTAVLEAVADRTARAGATVLTAVASRAEQALPFGVVGQLLHSMDLSSDTAALVVKLLDEGARSRWDTLAAEPMERMTARIVHLLCMAVLEQARDTPLVICVDDVDHADPPSVQWLSYLFRRLQNARVLVLLTCNSRVMPAHPQYHAEVLGNPRFRAMALEPLTRFGVAHLLRELPQLPARRASEYHTLTGGNPLLVRALVEDFRLVGAQPADPVPVGWAYGQAVLTCLYRSEPVVADVARAVAVLGAAAPAATLAGLLRTEVELVIRAVELLTKGGILDESGDYRHARARTAVLGEMAPDRRGELHRRAATMLHDEGAPVADVARHLTRADRLEASWMSQTLHEAAEQALAHGDADQARGCLRAALAASPDREHHAETRSRLARLEWLLNPAGVAPHLPELVAAARAGTLAPRHALAPLSYLLWHGRVSEATALLTALCERSGRDAEVSAGLRVALLWLGYTYPEQRAQVRASWELLGAGGGPLPQLPPTRASAVLGAMVALSPHGDAVAAAEQMVRGQRGDDALVPARVALAALVLLDRYAAAGAWAPNGAPWQALQAGVRADLELRQGGLLGGRQHARDALTELTPKGWGIGLGGVLATLVGASTCAGAYDDAAHYLGLPVPPGMFGTPFGVQYLRARGGYYLATDRARAAVSDFQACGDLLTAWDMDEPALLPWRSDLAQAYLALGRHRRARDLAQEQLRRVGEGQPRVRGATLRVLASASEPSRRVPMLREAVDLLQASGDRLEAVRALADLSDALHQVGESSRARMMVRTARTIARKSQAVPLLRRLQPDLSPTPRPAAAPDAPDELTELSDAERRVATLAALGHTNREIAGKLYVTVSTVEQHLTRVYRKLRVNGRSDLPSGLQLDVADSRAG